MVFLTSRIIQRQDKTRYWEDFDAYKDEENTALAIKSRFEVMLWMQGLESNFLENTPEQSMLRKIAQDRMEQAIKEEADKSHAEADAIAAEPVEEAPAEEAPDEAPVEELVLPEKPEKPKKKRTGRPKGSKNKPKPKKDE